MAFAPVKGFNDPGAWLDNIRFFTCILEKMGETADVHSVHLLDFSGHRVRTGVSYHFFKLGFFQRLLPLKLLTYIRHLEPDGIIVQGFVTPWLIVLLRLRLGRHVRIVIQHRAENPYQDVRRVLQRWAARYVSTYFFASCNQATVWIEKRVITSPSMVREVIGISSPFMRASRENARKHTGVVGSPAFIWVGNLDANKNPRLALEGTIRYAGYHAEATLYMIFQTEELLADLNSILDALAPGVGGRIHLVGRIPNAEMEAWYRSADVILSTSYREGIGIAVCEGMSCGCVPVLSDIPSFRKMTNEGKVGRLFQPGNLNAMVSALDSIDLSVLEKEKDGAAEHFERNLSPSAAAAGYLAAFPPAS